MNSDFRNGIVRILDLAKKNTVGTGFVVTSDGLIATCGHVVEDAGVQPGDFVDLVFYASQEKLKAGTQPKGIHDTEAEDIPSGTRKEMRKARVVPNYFRNARTEDVAILQLEGQLPPEVVPLPIVRSYNTEGQWFRAFGFPAAKPEEGMWSDCKVLGPDTENKFPVLQLSSLQLSRGFSGAPICDDSRGGVIGMATSIVGTRRVKLADKTINVTFDPDGRQTETAFATPVETLQAICPLLQASEECPYLGLSSFTVDDAKFFFGRDEVVDRLVNKLKKDLRFLAVLGPSGSGKSSIVQAGLLPKLKQGAIEDSDHWGTIIVRPGNDPFKQLADKGLADESQDLTAHVRAWLAQHPEHPRLVLVIDQFEELLITCPEVLCKSFVMQLTQLLGAPLLITVIIIMRDDFYRQFIQQEMLVKWFELSQVNIPPTLKLGELTAIVQKPAEAVRLRFEDGLVEAIVKDTMEVTTSSTEEERVARSTILPLLEFTLKQLWEKRDKDGWLTRKAYLDIGEVKGGLTRWADQAIKDLESEEKRRKARRIFIDLVFIGDEDQGFPDSGRRMPLISLSRNENEAAEVHQVVHQLATRRLLVTSQDLQSNQEMVEIIHNALLREWGQMRQWLKEDREFKVWHQEMERRVRAWIETDRDDPATRDASKLFRGSDLIKAIQWMQTRSEDLRPGEREFIQASKERQEQEERSRKRFTRRTVLVAVGAGLGLAGAGLLVGRFLLQENNQSTRSLPYSYYGHTSTVYSVAWSPDGKRIASASADDTVQVWDASTGNKFLTYKGHTNTVYSVAWSPDGKRIASASSDGTVQVWDASTGNKFLTYTGHAAGVYSVAWSPDGRRLASASYDKTVQVWDAATGNKFFTTEGRTSYVLSVAWSPDGKRIASAGNDATVQVWDASTGDNLFTYRKHINSVYSVAWSPDGKHIASASDDGRVQVWDASTGDNLFTYRRHTGAVNGVAWSPDGKRIASASDDGTVQMWDATTGGNIFSYGGHSGAVLSVAWSPDGKRIASAGRDKTVQIWDAVPKGSASSLQSNLFTYTGHAAGVYSVAWSPDGKRIASAGYDGTAQVWDATTGGNIFTYKRHTDTVAGVAWSPDSKRIASASYDKTVQVWDATTGGNIFTYKGHKDFVNSVAWSPDGKRIVSASNDGTVQVWDASTGSHSFTYKGHTGNVYSAVWSPNSKRIASASADHTVQVWDAADGGHAFTYRGHADEVLSVAWSPDGKRIVSASNDARVQLWDANTRNKILTYEGHTNSVWSVAWSPNGKRIASAGRDDTVQVWDASTGNKFLTYKGHTDTVWSVNWSPDSKRIASASDDRTVQVWQSGA